MKYILLIALLLLHYPSAAQSLRRHRSWPPRGNLSPREQMHQYLAHRRAMEVPVVRALAFKVDPVSYLNVNDRTTLLEGELLLPPCWGLAIGAGIPFTPTDAKYSPYITVRNHFSVRAEGRYYFAKRTHIRGFVGAEYFQRWRHYSVNGGIYFTTMGSYDFNWLGSVAVSRAEYGGGPLVGFSVRFASHFVFELSGTLGSKQLNNSFAPHAPPVFNSTGISKLRR